MERLSGLRCHYSRFSYLSFVQTSKRYEPVHAPLFEIVVWNVRVVGVVKLSIFCRNGHRKRQLITDLGVLDFWLPRVVCQCGGSDQIPFSVITPYQQIWVDIEMRVDRWGQT
jgi:hypothetical protein